MNLRDFYEVSNVLNPSGITISLFKYIMRAGEAGDFGFLKARVLTLRKGQQFRGRRDGGLGSVVLRRVTRDTVIIMVDTTFFRTSDLKRNSLSVISMLIIPRQFRGRVKRASHESILRRLFARVVVSARSLVFVGQLTRLHIRYVHEFRVPPREFLCSRAIRPILHGWLLFFRFFKGNTRGLQERHRMGGTIP